ncbi:hypothetical protein [Microbacterium paulum]
MARVGERGGRRLAGEDDVFDPGTIGIGPLGGVQQHLNAREPLGHGVVDLSREPGALGEHPRLALRRGELSTRREQLLHQRLALVHLAGECLVAEPDEQCDPGPHDRPDNAPGRPSAVDAEGAGRDRRCDHDGGFNPHSLPRRCR